ncbi:MAG: flavin reductase family protein [Clostridiaceae bacterium]|jgi:flavin reductase (DIM6/NTAB) family NADH-FMN oxidoreductase RutF|nr:flavin reductase family protein [Clostridiaceae bacterium]
MNNQFTQIKPEQITDNPFQLIGSDWMLVTAGNKDAYNTMTASWGGLGVLWGKNVAICYVRPSRYTYSFMEKADHFTLSFFDASYRKALNFCGSHSGREYDKAAETGLVPVQIDDGAVAFQQARLVLVCRKLYYQDFDPKLFLVPELMKNYPSEDYHRMYVGEIIKSLSKED